MSDRSQIYYFESIYALHPAEGFVRYTVIAKFADGRLKFFQVDLIAFQRDTRIGDHGLRWWDDGYQSGIDLNWSWRSSFRRSRRTSTQP